MIVRNTFLLNRYRHIIMGTKATADRNVTTTPVSTVSCDEEVMVIVAPNYLTRRESQRVNHMLPIQESTITET